MKSLLTRLFERQSPRTMKKSRKRSSDQISYNMSRVRSKGSKIELRIAAALRQRGLRFRCHARDLPGTPDFVLKDSRVCIFCDSEFWHGFRWRVMCKEFKSNRSFWVNKIEYNIRHDRLVRRQLRADGWTVIRLWERDILKRLQRCVQTVESATNNS